MILTQLKFENHHLMFPLCPPGLGRHPPHWPRLTPPFWPSILQKSDPFLADLRQASSLLQASIKEFEKGDPPGGAQVSQEHGVRKTHYSPDCTEQGLSEGDHQGGHDHPFVMHSFD